MRMLKSMKVNTINTETRVDLMDDLEEALRNIDVFCRILVKKLVDTEDGNIVVEPIEKLLYRKNIMDTQAEPNSSPKNLIPLPQAEEPLIDVFEDNNYVKVLMQCRCKDQPVTVHTGTDGVEICKKECHTNAEGLEVCTDKCQKLDVPVEHLEIENMIAKCSKNAVFEVNIPKTRSMRTTIS